MLPELSNPDVQIQALQAAHGDPAILLAGEPAGNLDSTNGEAVMELLCDLHREGATIYMVTHEPRYANHADRTVRLFDGRVVEERDGGTGPGPASGVQRRGNQPTTVRQPRDYSKGVL